MYVSLDVIVYGSAFRTDGSRYQKAHSFKGRLFHVSDISVRPPAWSDPETCVGVVIRPTTLGSFKDFVPEYFAVERNGFIVGGGGLGVNDDGVYITEPTTISVSKATYDVWRMSA
jgi:hypothetical protein